LIAANPALTIVLAHFFLPDERLTRHKVAGVLLALMGAALLTLRGESGLSNINQADPLGYLFMIAALLVSSSAMIHARKYLKDYHAFDVAGIRMFSAAMFTIPLAFLTKGFEFSRVNYQGLIALGYAALIGTLFGFLLQFYIIKRFGATSAVMSGYINPIVANLGGVILLDEIITTGLLFGMVMIFTGLYLINLPMRSRALPS
jgi:drug/metabolite transporter (DMT)-like permease